jgi:hypothetical protein
MSGSEAELYAQIEALRGELSRQVGDHYSRETIQAASETSSNLDRLILRWQAIQNEKKTD